MHSGTFVGGLQPLTTARPFFHFVGTGSSSSSSSNTPYRCKESCAVNVNSNDQRGKCASALVILAGALLSRRQRCRLRRLARKNAVSSEALAFLPLDDWLQEAHLHQDLAKDVEDRFGHVPQQDPKAVEDAVARLTVGARYCVAPSASAHPFGSTVNGFGEASSDLDVLIAVDPEELCYYMSYINWHQKEQRHSEILRRSDHTNIRLPDLPKATGISEKVAMACALQQLAAFLPELGFRVSKALPRARKPLLTVVDRTGGLGDCDVSINNRLPLCNSELLNSYSRLDWRVRPLVLLVKAWAKGHGVCGADRGNLSSYSWTIIVMNFLQLAGILPSLQKLAPAPKPSVDVDFWGFEREFDFAFLPVEEYKQKLATGEIQGCQGEVERKLHLGQLLYGFFRFLAKEYRWGSEVISMRDPVRRAADGWWHLFGKPQPEPCIHVEDPIELRDLNVVMRRERLSQLKVELLNAVSLLESGKSLEEFLSSPCMPSVEFAFVPRRARSLNQRRRLKIPKPAIF